MHAIKTIILSPFSAIYWLVTSLRNWCYDSGIFKSTSFDISIISVGNLAVGGSGKTPMVEYLISKLQNKYTIATLSRGYGRKTKGFLWVESHLDYYQTGDEPLQIKTKFENIAVAVCEDRVAGVKRILTEKPEINLILLDDAFQHRAIKPKIQLLLSAYSKPFFTDWLMPNGRLRERRVGAQRSDAILFTRCPKNHRSLAWKDKPIFYSTIDYHFPEIDGEVYGFSGLADNKPFAKRLEEQCDLVGFSNFKDHHNYTQETLNEIKKQAGDATLVCTEKDWVKVKSLQGSKEIKVVTIQLSISGHMEFLTWLKDHNNAS